MPDKDVTAFSLDLTLPRVSLFRRAEHIDLLLVAAPQGYGKTILGCQLAAHRGKCLWLNLDGDDNDVSHFYRHLRSTLGEHIESIWPGERLDDDGMRRHMKDLLHQLVIQFETALLIFDDVHVIQHHEVIAAISALADDLPCGLQVVLLSRDALPLQIAMRASKVRTLALSAGDLHFTAADCLAYLQQCGLSPADPFIAQTIAAATGGWPAAVFCLVQVLRSDATSSNFLASHAQPFSLDSALQTLLQCGPELLKRGASPLLSRLLKSVPEEVINASPLLLCLKLWSLFDAQKYLLGGALLDKAQHLVQTRHADHDVSSLMCEIYTLRTVIARLHNDRLGAQRYCHDALEYAASARTPTRWRSLMTLGAYDYQNGCLESACKQLNRAVAFAIEEEHFYGVLLSTVYLAAALVESANLHRACHVLEEARQWLMQRQANGGLLAFMLNIGRAGYLLASGELTQAQQQIDVMLAFRNDERCEHLHRSVILLLWYNISMSGGEFSVAAAALSEIERFEHAMHFQRTFAFANLPQMKARLWQRCGQRHAAWRIVQQQLTQLEQDNSFLGNIDRIAAASICIGCGETDLARTLLSWIAGSAEFGTQAKLRMSYLIQHALLSAATGRDAEAQNALGESLCIAEAGGFVQVFFDEGDALPGLLAKCSHAYANELLRHWQLRKLRQTTTLSPREHDILSMLRDGLSDKEISEHTSTTVGTVKTHLRNIYRKLQVKRRTQAIQRAQELQLLS